MIYLNIRNMFVGFSENYTITLVEQNHDDHVHILFKPHPNTEMTKFINTYKSTSSRPVKRDFPQVKKNLRKEMFQSRSFCLLTTGVSPIDLVKKYIENQGEK